MDGYVEKTNEVAVPKNTGIDGFLKTLRGILELRNVQNIGIDAKGVIRYTRYTREDEPDGPIEVDYTDLEPWAIIRNRDLQDIDYTPGTPASTVIAALFNMLAHENLVPIAFVTGTNSRFWAWHEESTGVRLEKETSAYGLPIYTDLQIPDHSLILCASHRRAGLVECHRFLLVTMNEVLFIPPETSVSVL
jgi:hypothetical protein